MAKSPASSDSPAEPSRAAPKPKQDDVLCYVTHSGPYRLSYNVAQRGEGGKSSALAVVPVSVELKLGLSTCPGEHWAKVKVATGFNGRRDKGQVVVVAGDEQGLEEGWLAAPQRQLVDMLARTGDVETLQRLAKIENRADRPRRDVSQAIDDALEVVKAAVETHRKQRNTQRTANRSKSW